MKLLYKRMKLLCISEMLLVLTVDALLDTSAENEKTRNKNYNDKAFEISSSNS